MTLEFLGQKPLRFGAVIPTDKRLQRDAAVDLAYETKTPTLTVQNKNEDCFIYTGNDVPKYIEERQSKPADAYPEIALFDHLSEPYGFLEDPRAQYLDKQTLEGLKNSPHEPQDIFMTSDFTKIKTDKLRERISSV